MRIAIVNQHPSVALGGSETQCELIATGLAARGHSVRYVAVGGAVAPVDPAYGLEIHPVQRSVRAVVEACDRFEPQIVYWRIGRWGLRAAARASRRSGFRLIMASSSDSDLIRVPPARSVRRSLVGRAAERVLQVLSARRSFGALREVDLIIVNNPGHLGRIPGVRATHVPNGAFTRTTDFGWPRPYVAWVANLKPVKRPEACIPLARSLSTIGVDVLMVGRIQVAGYEDFLHPERLPPNLHYLGPLPPEEANGILAGAELHVHTCEAEGFPNVFIQAWWHGVPSVSLGFDPGGAIRDEAIGLVCDDDQRRFESSVAALLGDTSTRTDMGTRAGAFARRAFDPERSVDRLVVELERLLADRSSHHG